MRGAWVSTVLAVVVFAGCGGGAAEGDSEQARSTTENAATQTLPWPPPTQARLVGKWDQEGERVVAWFKPDGTFSIGNIQNPFAVGKYELDGSTLTFTSDPTSSCKGSGWVWEVGLDTAGSEDRLRVLITEGGCGALTGEQWTFAEID